MRSAALITARALHFSIKSPFYLIFALTQPLIWLLLFGSLFAPVMSRLAGTGGYGYIAYIAPGIAIMSAAMSASYAGIQVLSDLQRGAMNRLFFSPASDVAIACSPLIHAGIISSVQAAVLLVVGRIAGAGDMSVLAVIVTAVVGFLVGVGFSGLSVAVALHFRQIQVIIGTMNFLTLPLTFLSSVLVAHRTMPWWMTIIAYANPIDWGASLARYSMGAAMTEASVVRNVALVVGFAAASCALSVLTLRRYRQSF
ncbi:ABC transporter permease [Sphingomonas oligophenolica]|uniref:Transport permease protein n=1 Tax=Sphingomonas oligophenolica TaxID=301154 RepID=A0A502CCB0_9SPHN|nr:ABC transporter permease [Sphingomonas oligophenolica]TPG10787.1 ABC transporter permease [Sphingomonas oligophenolica]